jgi:hypothetical protein
MLFRMRKKYTSHLEIKYYHLLKDLLSSFFYRNIKSLIFEDKFIKVDAPSSKEEKATTKDSVLTTRESVSKPLTASMRDSVSKPLTASVISSE